MNVPTELVRRINLDKLYPPFLAHYLDMLAALKDRGIIYAAYLGYRSVEEQDRLYAQGRTKPGKAVTNAPGLYSCHNYGIAVDSMRLVGGKDVWDDASYTDLLAEAPKHALQGGAGPGIRDLDHVQLPLVARLGRHEADVLVELRDAYKAGGLAAAWKHLDSFTCWA